MKLRAFSKRIMFVAAAFSVICVGLSGAAVVPTPFSHLRSIAAVSNQEEIAAIALDEAAWDLLKDKASNLCVFDATDAPVPFLVRRATARRVRRVRTACASEVSALRELPDNRVEIDLKLRKNAPTADTITLITPLKDFERRVSVDGVGADGQTERLVTDALVYDYMRFMDVRHVVVDLPRNDYRTLRITIDAVTDTTQSPRTEITRTIRNSEEAQRTETTSTTTRPFRITTVKLYAYRDEAYNRESVATDYKLKKWSVNENTKEQTSTIEIETYNTPLTSISIATAKRNFSRRATVLVPYQRDGHEQWRSVGGAALSRISFRNFSREALIVSFPEQQDRRFRLVLHNGDAPPLSIKSVTGHGPLYQVLFLAAPDRNYRLLLGDGAGTMPTFDTSHIERLLARDIPPRTVDAGPIVDNPDYSPKSGANVLSLLGSRGFFVIVIVVVVLVLGVGLVRAGKTALAENQEGSDS